jgi:hypothetical protein
MWRALALLLACDAAPTSNSPGSGSQGIDCAQVVTALRATYTADQVSMFRSDATMSRWFDTTMQVVGDACRQDAWPEAVKQCIVAAKPGQPNALQGCNTAMSAALQQKLQDRMVQAMKTTVKP